MARDHARGIREERNALLFLLPRAPFVLFTRPKSSFSSLCNACNESSLSLKEWNKMEWFQSYNIKILVKPSYYFNNIFVIFLSSQCSSLKCVIKAFNKRQCLNGLQKSRSLSFLTNNIELIMSAP